MQKDISRRDFLNGTQVAIGAALASPWIEAFGAPASPFALAPDYYPPARTGLRGSHDGAWEAMHARVSGARWRVDDISERFDLVVVGGGISGLSAAHFYRREKPGARILILDNHDDFGGHAKRNEFSSRIGTRIGYGGTESIDTPSSYNEISRALLADIGIDVNRFYKYYDQELYDSLALSYGIAFDADTYGKRKFVTGYGSDPWEEFAARTPMSEQARSDLVRAFTDERDYLPGMTRDEKVALLSRISYRDYLKDYVGVGDEVLALYQRWGMSFWCVGMDEVPAIAVQEYTDGGGLPGLEYTVPRVGDRGDEPYIFHFPDGNASVARLLVRKLIPGAVPGTTMEDVVTARIAYDELDRDDSDVRLRLNSTAVETRHTAKGNAVDVTYVHNGIAHKVRADRCVLACYNSAIPYICTELPDAQKQGLAHNVKVPLTYTKVLVQNWRPFAELGIRYAYFTKDFYKQVELDYPVSLGDYRFGSSPDEPMVLHMCYVPYVDDVQGPDQWREGRRRLLTTPFSTFEHHVRDQLDQALAGGGFDADRDIEAITVNRWPHGYSYAPGRTWEPVYESEADKPWVIGRQPFGRIGIANSDAGASADTNTAIVSAHRAVAEVLRS